MSSVENPGRSFFWAASFWNNFTEEVQYLTTYFHHCCYGSQRRKLTRLSHTLPLLEELCATCPGESPDHVHLPWGQAADGHFATSEETAYPLPLCKAWAHLVYEQLIALGAIGVPQQLDEFHTNPIRAAKVLAEQHPRGKRIPPLVKEFKHVMTLQCPSHCVPPTKVDEAWPIPPDVETDLPLTSLPHGARTIRFQNLSNGANGLSAEEGDASDHHRVKCIGHPLCRHFARQAIVPIPRNVRECQL